MKIEKPAYYDLAMENARGILQRMKAGGMTTTQVALALGVSRTSVHRVLDGLQEPSMLTVCRMIVTFGVDPGAIFPAPDPAEVKAERMEAAYRLRTKPKVREHSAIEVEEYESAMDSAMRAVEGGARVTDASREFGVSYNALSQRLKWVRWKRGKPSKSED